MEVVRPLLVLMLSASCAPSPLASHAGAAQPEVGPGPVAPQEPPSAGAAKKAGPTAQERLDACVKLYHELKSYRDEGAVTTEFDAAVGGSRRVMTFETAFEQGARFRWQGQELAVDLRRTQDRATIWSADGKTFDCFWTLTGHYRRGVAFDEALSGTFGSTDSGLLPMLGIVGKVRWGIPATLIVGPVDGGEEPVDGVPCRKIAGSPKYGEGKIEVWIDEAGLIRKVYREQVVDPAQAGSARAEGAPELRRFTSRTTVRLTPVMNETKIADARFVPDEGVASKSRIDRVAEFRELHEASIEALRERADKGEAAAQVALGDRYYFGRDVAKDEDQATAWYRKAAQQGDVKGQAALARMYWRVEGPEGVAGRIEWWTKAADQGHAESAMALALHYQPGQEKEGDAKKAVEWFKRAAELGDVGACETLGGMFRHGTDVERNGAEAVRWYTKGAELGNTQCQWALREMLFHGEGVTKDPAGARRWAIKAAESGGPRWQMILGRQFLGGHELERDPAEGVRLLTKAAEQGDLESQQVLARTYATGVPGVPADPARALQWFLEAGSRGDLASQVYAANLYLSVGTPYSDPQRGVAMLTAILDKYPPARERLMLATLQGTGTAKDPAKAAEMLAKGEIYQDTRLQDMLKRRYAVAYGKGWKDLEEAPAWLERQATAGLRAAQRDLGMLRFYGMPSGRDPAAALKWLSKAAEQGDPEVPYVLARMYAGGDGVAQDLAAAGAWLEKAYAPRTPDFLNWTSEYTLAAKPGDRVPTLTDERMKRTVAAAEAGDAESLNTLGICYRDGVPLPKDPAKALEYFKKASEHGSLGSRYNLGLMYETGDGVAKDPAEAVRWYTEAAEFGQNRARVALAGMLARGQGAPKDVVRAHVLLTLAGLNGSAEGARGCDELAKMMTPEQLAESRTRVTEYKPREPGGR